MSCCFILFAIPVALDNLPGMIDSRWAVFEAGMVMLERVNTQRCHDDGRQETEPQDKLELLEWFGFVMVSYEEKPHARQWQCRCLGDNHAIAYRASIDTARWCLRGAPLEHLSVSLLGSIRSPSECFDQSMHDTGLVLSPSSLFWLPGEESRQEPLVEVIIYHWRFLLLHIAPSKSKL